MLIYKSLACFLSFELAFLANVLILLSGYKNYKRLVVSSKVDFTPPRPVIFAQRVGKIKRFYEGPKARKNAKIIFGFFSLFKVLAYVFLILVFIWLQNNSFLVLLPLFAGLFVLPLASLILLIIAK